MSRWNPIDWDAQPLGVVPDRELGRRLGVTFAAVAKARRKRGLASPIPARPKGICWDAHPLGAISDADLARRLGVTRNSVAYARNKRGIPRHSPVVSRGPKAEG